MATLKQADKARAVHSAAIADKGAHAIGVEPGKAYGLKGYIVVAYVDPDKNIKLPGTITIEDVISKSDVLRQISVPLLVRKAEMFEAQ